MALTTVWVSLNFVSTAACNFSVLSYWKNSEFTEQITYYFQSFQLLKLWPYFQLWLFELFSFKFIVEAFLNIKKIPQAQ